MAEQRASWKTWARKAISKGAKLAHRFTHSDKGWRPTTVVAHDGSTTSDPCNMLEDKTSFGQDTGKTVAAAAAVPVAAVPKLAEVPSIAVASMAATAAGAIAAVQELDAAPSTAASTCGAAAA